MSNQPLTKEYLDNYYFEMFSKAGEAACRSVVRAAWKKLSGRTRVTGKEMANFVETIMGEKSKRFPEIWDTEPREHIRHLIAKKAEECEYDFSESFIY
jgi:hypothetical protein